MWRASKWVLTTFANSASKSICAKPAWMKCDLGPFFLEALLDVLLTVLLPRFLGRTFGHTFERFGAAYAYI